MIEPVRDVNDEWQASGVFRAVVWGSPLMATM